MASSNSPISRAIEEEDIEMAICYSIMTAWSFNYTQRLEWEIWAAKHQTCPTCFSSPHHRCVHMGDIKAKKLPPRVNKRPHPLRVDWTRLLNGLKQREYYRPAIEAQVRKMVR
jgi:hypothetical protein